jgi:FtsP/CotA-like multicopper oxidase with cupredoxin domain
MSTHVHGLEVRPAFDGNPLSWYTMLAKGVGYLSAEDVYFSKMTEMEANLIRSLFATQNQQVKINMYRNTQLPGSLWYHDHAMSSTGFNVRKGMSGMYLLRNSSLQVGANKPLPIKKYEQNILIALGSYDVQEGNANGATFSSKKEFESDVWWRMRILNADFNAYYEDLRFVYFDSQGQEIIIPFKVIGADSSLRRTVLSGQTEVSLASAERVDVLIKFESSVLPKGSNVYFVQGHDPQDDHYKLFVITVGDICVDPEGISYVPPSTIDVPFTDLSAMPDQNISKIRMRPLMRAWNMDGYGVNGHLLYHKGDSEQPEIGTTEDWYFINGMYTYTIDHPMHVHLINFQEVYEYTLLKMKVR